jgi:hypothetical protein
MNIFLPIRRRADEILKQWPLHRRAVTPVAGQDCALIAS